MDFLPASASTPLYLPSRPTDPSAEIAQPLPFWPHHATPPSEVLWSQFNSLSDTLRLRQSVEGFPIPQPLPHSQSQSHPQPRPHPQPQPHQHPQPHHHTGTFSHPSSPSSATNSAAYPLPPSPGFSPFPVSVTNLQPASRVPVGVGGGGRENMELSDVGGGGVGGGREDGGMKLIQRPRPLRKGNIPGPALPSIVMPTFAVATPSVPFKEENSQ
eukprot:TRINITY_DN8003_c0_g1_i1.p1 TRINITY_DN8003_c0_g1~~TRINITY_DN8003_c0_g1_i1.p1  ORF type:complete len:223 (-),score=37.59 TRINITY_DN8003_c0_g1_i1:34-675(-)